MFCLQIMYVFFRYRPLQLEVEKLLYVLLLFYHQKAFGLPVLQIVWEMLQLEAPKGNLNFLS